MWEREGRIGRLATKGMKVIIKFFFLKPHEGRRLDQSERLKCLNLVADLRNQVGDETKQKWCWKTNNAICQRFKLGHLKFKRNNIIVYIL